MKQLTKAATSKVVKNVIAHIADTAGLEEVVLNSAQKVHINEEALAKLNDKVGKTTVTSAAESFQEEKKAAGPAIVCNINGLNVSVECRIECVPNPKRAGSKAHERYETYAMSTTVGEYLANGGLKADLRYDNNKGFLRVMEIIREGKLIVNPNA